jgi:hypothetical protein
VEYWMLEHSEFRAQYVVARKAQVEALVDKAIYYAETATPENAHARRLYVDTIKWYASKIAATTYGEKVDVTVNGTLTVSAAIEEGRKRLARLRNGESNVIELPTQALSLAAPSEETSDA